MAEVRRLAGKKYVVEYPSMTKLRRAVRRKPVVSKLVVVEKTKVKTDKQGNVRKNIKKRIILNLRTSGVSAASAKHERVILPRALDVIFDVLELLKAMPLVTTWTCWFVTSPMLSGSSLLPQLSGHPWSSATVTSTTWYCELLKVLEEVHFCAVAAWPLP